MTRRKAIHAYVEDDTHANWRDHCASHGISVAALLETLAEGQGDTIELNYLITSEHVARARQIDAARRNRTAA